MRLRAGRSRLAILSIGLAWLVVACSQPAAVEQPFEGATATIAAINGTFDPVEVTLPADTPLRLILDNQDAGVPHDIRVFQGDREIARSPTVTGPGTAEVRFGPLPAARYQFQCAIHPNMLGTLIVTADAPSALPTGSASRAAPASADASSS